MSRVIGAGQIGHDDMCALCRWPSRAGSADPGGCTRYDSDPIFEALHHISSPKAAAPTDARSSQTYPPRRSQHRTCFDPISKALRCVAPRGSSYSEREGNGAYRLHVTSILNQQTRRKLRRQCAARCDNHTTLAVTAKNQDSDHSPPPNLRESVPVINRMPTPNVRYAQNQFSRVLTRLRVPTKNPTCTRPHNHQAGSPDILMNPKSATAALRPMVARLPRCRYRNSG